MSDNNAITLVNQRLARQINQQARNDSNSPYTGKSVGIANGQVVVVGNSWREVVDGVRQVESDAAKCCCIEASGDYDSVYHVWSAA